MSGLWARLSDWNRERRVRRRTRRIAATAGASAAARPDPPPVATDPVYARWIEQNDTLTPERVAAFSARAAVLAGAPSFDLIATVDRPDPARFGEFLHSVASQVHGGWTLWLVDRAGDPIVRGLIADAVRREPRIRTVAPGADDGVAGLANRALQAGVADFVGFVGAEDRLRPHSLLALALAARRHPDAELIYADEDEITVEGSRQAHHFRPDWNPELLRSTDYLGDLTLWRRTRVKALGGLREGFPGAEHYELLLRCAEVLQPHQVAHVPFVLYHRFARPADSPESRDASHRARESALRALQAHLDRVAPGARAAPTRHGRRVRHPLPAARPSVTLIIPTRDNAHLLKQCIDGVLARTIYPNYGIEIIDNGSVEDCTHDYLATLACHPRIRIRHDPSPFNWSRLNNQSAARSDADLLCLLNNDIEPIHADWLHELVAHALRPEVGVVGARLWYPDRRLQHAGIVMGIGGLAGHVHRFLPPDDPGYHGRAQATQSFSALTGACLVLRSELFRRLGGLNERELTVACSDSDLCLKAASLGLRNVWTPHAELVHHELATRGADDSPAKRARAESETAYMLRRWPDVIASDPAYNPQLTFESEDFAVAPRPRVSLDDLDVATVGRNPVPREGPL